MKNTILLLLSLFFLLPGNAQPNKDEVIFKAMQDEIERNSNELMLPGMPKPFFISYGLGCFRQFEVVGILGSIVNATEIPSSAVGSVELLLGDYEHTSDASYAHPMTHVPMPGEADYDALRRGYWQGSDVMYKWALRGMAAKEAYEKANPQNVDGEKLPDLNKVPAVQKIVEDKGDFAIDMEAMENMVRELSVIFKDYKDIENSVVMLSGFDTDIYKKTSADVEMKQPLRYVNLVVQAQTMTADGERIGDIYSVVTDSPQKLPDVEKLKQDVVAFADNLMKLRDAEKLQEDYKGPVLFEGGACSSMFIANLLNKNALFATRLPAGAKDNYRAFSEQIGKKVIDERISIKNYSTLEQYGETQLLGAYQIDAEGVVPEKEMTLIENGMLKKLLNGAIPAQKASQSTGSSRYLLAPNNLSYTTAPGTIHVLAEDAISQEKMKKALLKAAKAEKLDYAYIVRKVAGAASLVYRVNVKDGSEELVRFATISSVGLPEMEEFLEISAEENAFNYVLNGQVLSSMICPKSVLLGDVDIRRMSIQTEKKPILVSPLRRD